MSYPFLLCVFFFNDTATTEIYTLSLHDALPIFLTVILYAPGRTPVKLYWPDVLVCVVWTALVSLLVSSRSEEHTSELQSRSDLVCRLLLEKKISLYASTLPPIHY